jgi:hypothetical protein
MLQAVASNRHFEFEVKTRLQMRKRFSGKTNIPSRPIASRQSVASNGQ